MITSKQRAQLRGMAAASILNNVAPFESDVAESVADYADGDRLAMQGEQNEIITALEGIRYGLPAAEIMGLLAKQ